MPAVWLTETIERIDALVRQRMAEDGTPGLALAVTNRDRLLYSAAWGVANIHSREPLTTSHLMETGSIGKSFTAIALLQLHAEGRIDLHAPISTYLPWFDVQTTFDPPTIHHALAHTTGLSGGTDFSPDPRYEVWALRELAAGCPPGEYFHYSNLVYKALGLVLEHLESKPYAEIIRERILNPLGMEATEAAITHATRLRMAQPYAPYYDDRPHQVSNGLVPATWLETNTGDGCLASSIVDLATYLRMFLNRGQGQNSNVLTDQTFDLMTQHVATRDDGAYGYGIMTSELNDSTVLHHDGGMVGYSSAMVGDLNAGVGVVAFVNGPGNSHDIAWHALECLQASLNRRPLPAALPARNPQQVDNAADYAGTFRSPDGTGTLTLIADGERLLLDHNGERVTLQRRGKDRFLVPDDDFALFLLSFSRNDSDVVTEATFGPNWYSNEQYDGPTTFNYPTEWNAFPGHYRTHNPWTTNVRVILRKGGLFVVFRNGEEERLHPLPDGSFRPDNDARNPERCRFDTLVDGVTLRMDFSNEALYRFFTP